MGSKKLNIPITNFNYGVGAVAANRVQPVQGVTNQFPSKGKFRGNQHQSRANDQSWKDNLPAYDYQTRTGKKMDLPKRDDSLLGGFSNLRAGNMTVRSAKSYMEAKAMEDAKRKADLAQKNAEFNPFNGMFSDDEF